MPVIIFGPIAGVLVDRWQKKKVMIVCDSLRMLCAILVPVFCIATNNIYPVFVVVFFMFLLTLFFNTARSAIIPNLVQKKGILKANSVINLVGRAATFIGMLAGGLIIDWQGWYRMIGFAGWTVAFIFDAITFAISALMLYFVEVKVARPIKVKSHLEAVGFMLLVRNGLKRIWCELIHAIQMIPKEKNLGFAMLSILLIVIGASIIYVLVIPTVQQDMDWGTSGVGILAAAGAIGLLVGAFIVGVAGHHIELKKLMTICFLLIGSALLVFPLLTDRWMLAVAITIGGFAISPLFIGQETLIHRYADELVRGRMFSIRDWIYHSSIALASLFIGFLATILKKDIIFYGAGIILMIMTIFAWLIYIHGKSPSIPQDYT